MTILPGAGSPYEAWITWLAAFAGGEDLPMSHLAAMDPERLGGAVASRLANRSADTVTARLALWHRAFGRDLSCASQASQLPQILQAARHRLTPIRAFVGSELLMPELRHALTSGLAEALQSAQQSLDDHAKRERLEVREDLLRTIRQQDVSRAPAFDDLPDDGRSAPAGARRSILLG